MFQKKQTLLSIAVAFTVVVLIVGITTLPAYSQADDLPVADTEDKYENACDALEKAMQNGTFPDILTA